MNANQRLVLLWPASIILILVYLVVGAILTKQPGASSRTEMKEQSLTPDKYILDYSTPVDSDLQKEIERIDTELRVQFSIAPEQIAVGLLDLRRLHLAMIRPDHIEYAASVAKVGILLAYFQLHPDAATQLDPQIRHELGLMAKASNNEMAAKYSRELGLKQIQSVLDSYGFYDANRGGGLWVGRHYGNADERYGDPVANHSHAITARQVLRFYLLLEQGKLVSPQASRTMKEIFNSPDIPHDQIKFVQGIGDRPGIHILRKWGSWEDWLHDTAIVTGPSRNYILVGITHHRRGDEYLVALSQAVDDLLSR